MTAAQFAEQPLAWGLYEQLIGDSRIDLGTIATRLRGAGGEAGPPGGADAGGPGKATTHYGGEDGPEELVSDVRRVFFNARLFNSKRSALARAAARLDALTEAAVEAWLASLPVGNGDDSDGGGERGGELARRRAGLLTRDAALAKAARTRVEALEKAYAVTGGRGRGRPKAAPPVGDAGPATKTSHAAMTTAAAEAEAAAATKRKRQVPFSDDGDTGGGSGGISDDGGIYGDELGDLGGDRQVAKRPRTSQARGKGPVQGAGPGAGSGPAGDGADKGEDPLDKRKATRVAVGTSFEKAFPGFGVFVGSVVGYEAPFYQVPPPPPQ